jgi:uroporphyrinogen-III synthase
MRVLITRAAPEASATALRVAALGCEPVLSPVLEIEAIPFDFAAADVQALAFTSAAGVRAFAAAQIVRARPILAVGEATGEAARAVGFDDVRMGEGAGDGIALLARALDPADGAVVHVGGEDIASDVVNDLRAIGFTARRVIAYRARFAARLAPVALDLLAAQEDAAVMFHSARGAESFIALARAAGLARAAENLVALCLSARVAEAAEPFGFKAIRIAASPRESALLALLGDGAADRA